MTPHQQRQKDAAHILADLKTAQAAGDERFSTRLHIASLERETSMSKIETTGAVATCNLWDDRFVSQLWLESESEDPLMIKAAFGDTREESARKLSDFVESADSEFDDYDEGTHATAFIACLKNLKKQEGR